MLGCLCARRTRTVSPMRNRDRIAAYGRSADAANVNKHARLVEPEPAIGSETRERQLNRIDGNLARVI